MSRKNKFKQKWSNQTNLGKLFGISSIEVGKILIENGLKDQKTKDATHKAISEGFAISTPLKDGTNYFMWNKQKIKEIISGKHGQLNKIDYWIAEVNKIKKQAEKLCDEGNDKLGYMLWDTAYDEIPKDIKQEVENKIEKKEK